MNKITSSAIIILLLLIAFSSMGQTVTNFNPFRDVGNCIFTVGTAPCDLAEQAGPFKISCGVRAFIDHNRWLTLQPGVATRKLQLTGTVYYLCCNPKPKINSVKYKTRIETSTMPGIVNNASITTTKSEAITNSGTSTVTTNTTATTIASTTLTPSTANWMLTLAVDHSDYNFYNKPGLNVKLTVKAAGEDAKYDAEITFNEAQSTFSVPNLTAGKIYEVTLEITSDNIKNTPNIRKKLGYKWRKMITYSHIFDLIVSAK